MPDILVDKTSVNYIPLGSSGTRPLVKLPETNLVDMSPPPGMSYNETYQWQLAMLLEGKAACVEPLPSWEPGSVHFEISKFLSYATRHSSEVKTNSGNWISVDWLLQQNRRKLHTPEAFFQAVFFNEKGRYQFARPQYESTQGRRATGRVPRKRAEPFSCQKLCPCLSRPQQKLFTNSCLDKNHRGQLAKQRSAWHSYFSSSTNCHARHDTRWERKP